MFGQSVCTIRTPWKFIWPGFFAMPEKSINLLFCVVYRPILFLTGRFLTVLSSLLSGVPETSCI